MAVGTCRSLGGYEPDLRHRSSDADVQLELVRAAAAVALMPALTLPTNDPAIAVRDVAETTLRRRLVVTRDTPPAPALTALAGSDAWATADQSESPPSPRGGPLARSKPSTKAWDWYRRSKSVVPPLYGVGVRETLAVMRKALDECPAPSLLGLSLGEVVSCVDDLQVVVRRVAAMQLALIRQIDAVGVAAELGATSTVAWLRDRYRLSGSTASKLVTLARAVDADAGTPVAAALAAGAVNVDQAAVIVDAVSKLPVEHRRAGEEHLVGEAASFGPRELGRLGQRIFEVVAPAEADKRALAELERAERRAWHKRGLWLTDIPGTSDVRLHGVLTVEDAAIFRAATDPLCTPRTRRRRAGHTGRAASLRGSSDSADSADPGSEAGGGDIGGDIGGDTGDDTGDDTGHDTGHDTDPADLRSPGERRLDAAIEVFRLACACGQLPDNGGDRPQVIVTIDYDSLRRQVGAGTLDDGSNLSPAAARRIACDAAIIPAVLGSRSQPLDVGRQSRLVTGPLRRALVLRDGGCTFPGCDRPPPWTDAHHIIHWGNGGPTHLGNLALLCRPHHRLVHHTDWQIRINPKDGLPEFIPPAYIDPDQRPRRNRYHRRE
jgi:hypothetical protein